MAPRKGVRRLNLPIAVKPVDRAQNRRIRKIEKKLGKVETKYNMFSNYNANDGQNIDTISAARCLQFNYINDGDLPIERDGNKVTVKKIQYLCAGTVPVAHGANDNFVRFIAFYWKGDTVPTIGDIIQFPAAGAGIPDDEVTPIYQLNLQNKNAVILKDKLIRVEGTTYTNSTRGFYFKWTKKFKAGKEQYYSDTSGGDMKTGFYYILAAAVGGANSVVVHDGAVTLFTEM